MSLRTAVVFAETPVKSLSERDFLLDSREALSIKWDDCILVLFYDDSDQSKNLTEIWTQAAVKTTGPVFAGINLVSETRVANRFTQIRMDLDHPLNWATIAAAPYIIVYRKGWPQAFFNGNLDADTIHEYAVSLACQPGYREYYEGASQTGEAATERPATEKAPAKSQQIEVPTSSSTSSSQSGLKRSSRNVS